MSDIIKYIDDFEYAKDKLNYKLNLAREKFEKEKNQENKKEYLELIEDMRRLNILDQSVIKKYL